MNNSENITEVVGALLAAQAEFEVLSKSSDNPFFHSKYIALPDLVVAVNPTLTKYGLGISQLVSNLDGQSALTTILFHTSGQYISSTTPLHLSKNDPQAHGSAITYMRRYSYMSILGLVADEDDDGNAASSASHNNNRQAPKKAEQPSLNDAVAAAAGTRPRPASNKSVTEPMVRAIWAITHKSLNMNDPEMFDAIDAVIQRKVSELTELTFDEARLLIEHFKSLTEE